MNRRAWGLVAMFALAACTSRVGQDEQCSFNDDCEAPLVCSAARCRLQCRSDRDCPSNQLCAPSESPRKRVCVARTAEALCASDGACPAGSVCAGNACWWRCSTDPECAARNAMTCMPRSASASRRRPRFSSASSRRTSSPPRTPVLPRTPPSTRARRTSRTPGRARTWSPPTS
ncbi:MAG: hypothetical protein IPN17_15890 [Deltaproteobacteria bacterium]|nr:hypothetical protein [Deltaproteobacteria bacterium]